MHRLNPSDNATALPAEHLGADDAGPFLWVRDIVMRPSRPGDAPHYGMQRFPVDIAYVLDLSYHDDQVVDFTKLQPVAAVDIDDLPDDQEATAHGDQLAAPPPSPIPEDLDVERTTPVETADQLTTPPLAAATTEDLAAPAEPENLVDATAPPGTDSGPDIDDLPDDEETTARGDQLAAPPPSPIPEDLDVERTAPVETGGHGGQLAAPPPVFPTEDLDAAPAEPEDLGAATAPPRADSGPDIDVERTIFIELDHRAEDSPFSSDIAVRSDQTPVAPPAAVQPEHQEPAQSGPLTPVAAEPVANGHREPLDPVPSATGALSAAIPAAPAPGDGEITGPLPTEATARPSDASVAETGAIARAQRRPSGPPSAPPSPSMPFGPAAAPPARPPRFGGPPVQTSTWPHGARPPHSAPERPALPWNGTPPPVIPVNRGRRTPSARALAIGAAVLAALILVVLAVWSVARSDTDTGQPSAPMSTQAKLDAETLKRLNAALPKGYSESSCSPDEAAADATVTCGRNTDPGGPVKATYTLYADKRTLTRAFTETIGKFEQVTCPGNIQSPGPWRRNAAPDTVAGTLFCGIQAGQAVVVWTSDAQLLLNVVESGAQGPSSLDQLYTWWGTHS
ncbi:hypothetical protein [Mycolicibacterium palauense]|uniref:hypothetical protein n=1 Tax=Mycolicibacterium palauense TaxID=2034511 RepID=UPI00114587E1|nr:hypothetical protein [Mycolicibacterium palauense]